MTAINIFILLGLYIHLLMDGMDGLALGSPPVKLKYGIKYMHKLSFEKFIVLAYLLADCCSVLLLVTVLYPFISTCR